MAYERLELLLLSWALPSVPRLIGGIQICQSLNIGRVSVGKGLVGIDGSGASAKSCPGQPASAQKNSIDSVFSN